MNLIKKKENFILLLAIIVFLTINNFFYNFYFILKKNYSERMTYHYGYCDKNGYGFIKHIREKYKLTNNIKIFNYIEKPNSEWFFYNPNMPYYIEKIILLNVDNLNKIDEENIKVYFKNDFQGNFKIIESYKNCFFVEKIND